MKALFKAAACRLTFLCCMVTITSVLTSCDEDHWRISSYLSGEWRSNDDPRSTFQLYFSDNGYGWVEERFDGIPQWNDSFEWWADRDYIYVRYDYDGYPETWAYDTDRRGLYIQGLNGYDWISFVRWY